MSMAVFKKTCKSKNFWLRWNNTNSICPTIIRKLLKQWT